LLESGGGGCFFAGVMSPEWRSEGPQSNGSCIFVWELHARDESGPGGGIDACSVIRERPRCGLVFCFLTGLVARR
ncbi:MAG TPA: hypothetical protein PLO20_03375, partial [Thermogutta sp.]|nr:hypothetical protein [Thermogutta sp.]